MPFESAVRTNSSCSTSRIELFIIRSQTAASGRPTTIHGTIIEPSQRSGLSANGTYLTGMNPMPGDRDAGAEEQQHGEPDDVDRRAQEHHRDGLDRPRPSGERGREPT